MKGGAHWEEAIEETEESEEADETEELDDASADPFAKPGVPKSPDLRSKPRIVVAVTQLAFSFQEEVSETLSMLALIPLEGLFPAKGTPEPSSTSSISTPL